MGKLVKKLGSIDRILNKREVIDLAKNNAQAIIDSGKYDLLKVYVELKRYEAYLNGLIQGLKSPALEKAKESGQKPFEYNAARVNIWKRTKWDYSVDKRWNELENQIKQLIKERKIREKHLKDINKVRTTIDKETGEMREEFDLPKEIKHTIAVKL